MRYIIHTRLEDYPQPVTGLIKDKSTEKKGIGIPNLVYNDNQSKGATDITNKRVNERRSAEDSLMKINDPGNTITDTR